MLDPRFPQKNKDLQDAFDFVHTANVLHLFDVNNQEICFRNLVSLVKPRGIIWGRQVGLPDAYKPSYKQPDGKGARFTIAEFRDFCLGIMHWSLADIEFEAQLVKYDELRIPREDGQWVLQWSIRVPERKLPEDRVRPMEEIEM
jgi:hypothetical protein